MRRGRRGLAIGLVAGVGAVAGTLAWPAAGPGVIGPPRDPCALVSTNCITVTVSGAGVGGEGVITTQPPGINCTVKRGEESGTCSAAITFTTASLTLFFIATPSVGSAVCRLERPVKICVSSREFSSGFRIGFGFTDGDVVTETYSFEPSEHTLAVTKSGAGTGSVKSERVQGQGEKVIDCGAKCSSSYTYGTKVTLTAAPDAGARFKSWTGACNGQDTTCVLTIQKDTSTNAVFDLADAPGGGGQTGGGRQPGAADKTVDVDVIGAAGGFSKIGKRVVKLELSLGENVAAILTLRRGTKVLATKKLARVREGDRVLTLLVPLRTVKGKAKLAWQLTDEAGNRVSGQRAVMIKKL